MNYESYVVNQKVSARVLLDAHLLVVDYGPDTDQVRAFIELGLGLKKWRIVYEKVQTSGGVQVTYTRSGNWTETECAKFLYEAVRVLTSNHIGPIAVY